MLENPSWESRSCSFGHEISCLICNRKVRCYIRKSPLLVPILSQFSPVHTLTIYCFVWILVLFSHFRLGLPGDRLPSSFPTKLLCAVLLFSKHAPCLVHPFLYLIMLTINSESNHYATSPPSLTVFTVSSNILLIVVFWEPSICVLRAWSRILHPYKRSEIMVLHL